MSRVAHAALVLTGLGLSGACGRAPAPTRKPEPVAVTQPALAEIPWK